MNRMKKEEVKERVSFLSKDGFDVDIRPFPYSDKKCLQAWREALSKQTFMGKLGEIAKKARQARLLEEEIYSLAKDLDTESCSMAERVYTEGIPRDITDGKGFSWYEIPVDGSSETAREVYARYCEYAFKCYPNIRGYC